jgi:hypothetical protein
MNGAHHFSNNFFGQLHCFTLSCLIDALQQSDLTGVQKKSLHIWRVWAAANLATHTSQKSTKKIVAYLAGVGGGKSRHPHPPK